MGVGIRTFMKGGPTPKNTHQIRAQFAQTNSEQFVQTVPPFPCKTSRKEAEELVQTAFIWVGGLLGELPSLEECPLLEYSGEICEIFGPNVCVCACFSFLNKDFLRQKQKLQSDQSLRGPSPPTLSKGRTRSVNLSLIVILFRQGQGVE